MMSARERNLYASVRYNKIIIEDKVYRYNDVTNRIVYIGGRSNGNRQPLQRAPDWTPRDFGRPSADTTRLIGDRQDEVTSPHAREQSARTVGGATADISMYRV
jgi:hypothetical protein